MDDGAEFGLTLALVGLFWLLLLLRGRSDPWVRMGFAAVCILMTIRYGAWRATASLPETDQVFGTVWARLFLGVELITLVSQVISIGVLSRTRQRSGELAGLPVGSAAPVDVFIATYNESREILERTILGALAIEHGDLRVWVLDDGARDWVRALAVELGAQYVCRVKGKHAKAGNVNNGLAVACRTGRKPEFVLLLDADFVANRTILRRTLPFFSVADVGVVQTPQRFFNPDPIQVNVLTPSIWPDEQAFFFRVLQPSLDAWGGAFCCGTSAVLRVAALEAIGGMATETVTEDMLTSFKLVEAGWRTIFLDEPLSLGLAPEGVGEYVVQRGRWCLGAIQQMYTRYGFAGRARMPLICRVNHFASVLYWMVTFPFRLMVLAVPAVWWWTGAAVIDASAAEVVSWILPYVACSVLFNAVYSHNRLVPVLSDVTQLVPSMAVMGSVLTGLVRPWGQPFKVTPKGLNSAGVTVHWRLLAPFLGLALVTLAGIAVNLPSDSAARAASGYTMTAIWSLVSVLVLLLTCLACIDQPRRRTDERFLSGERAVALVTGRAQTPCVVRDISVGGACLVHAKGWADPPQGGTLWLDEGRLTVRFATVRASGNRLGVRFEPTPPQRQTLILKLFDVFYRPEIDHVDLVRAALTAVQRVLSGPVAGGESAPPSG